MTNHYRGMVYRNYYNYFDDTPYYESIYLAPNVEKPYEVQVMAEPNKIKLQDGTIIETFSGNYNNIIIIILIVIVILILFLNK